MIVEVIVGIAISANEPSISPTIASSESILATTVMRISKAVAVQITKGSTPDHRR
jgi:hypothetical protein